MTTSDYVLTSILRGSGQKNIRCICFPTIAGKESVTDDYFAWLRIRLLGCSWSFPFSWRIPLPRLIAPN